MPGGVQCCGGEVESTNSLGGIPSWKSYLKIQQLFVIRSCCDGLLNHLCYSCAQRVERNRHTKSCICWERLSLKERVLRESLPPLPRDSIRSVMKSMPGFLVMKGLFQPSFGRPEPMSVSFLGNTVYAILWVLCASGGAC